MTIQNDCPAGRSQFLTFESDDKIVVDRQTLTKLLLLLERCADNLSYQFPKVLLQIEPLK